VSLVTAGPVRADLALLIDGAARAWDFEAIDGCRKDWMISPSSATVEKNIKILA